MAQHNALGKVGEEKARTYLESKGYKIVEKNQRTKRGETDLIATKGRCLIFVEVRAKGTEEFGIPEDTIDWRKKKKLLWNAKAYVFYTGYKGPYRIDAICIVFDDFGGVQRLTHYESIVEIPM